VIQKLCHCIDPLFTGRIAGDNNAFSMAVHPQYMKNRAGEFLSGLLRAKPIYACVAPGGATGNRIIVLWILARNYRTGNTKVH
jgi:hypothetical protein